MIHVQDVQGKQRRKGTIEGPGGYWQLVSVDDSTPSWRFITTGGPPSVGFIMGLGFGVSGGGIQELSLVPTDGLRLIGIEQCNPSFSRTCTNVPSLIQLQTILDKHYHNRKPGKSIFGSWASNPMSLILAIGKVLEGSYIEQHPGQRAYTRDLGFVVGTDQQGRSTTYMTVITHNFGSIDGFWDVANSFPGKTGR